jgi:hypothetical protein
VSLLAASVLAQCLVAGERDDRVDIVRAIDEASEDVRAVVAEVQRRRLARSDPMRSGVPGGSKFGGGRWRLVGPWPHPEPVLIFGGEEGFRVVYPGVEEEGLIG